MILNGREVMNKKDCGFSLIELVIVVAIIGILVAIALPQYQNYQLRTKVAEALVMVERVKSAIEVYHQEHGRWPAAIGGLLSFFSPLYLSP